MPDRYGRGLSCGWQALGVLTTFIAISSLAPIALEGQAQTWRLPHTAWGDPDLQGTWNFANLTPLERPKELSGKDVLTEQEAAAFEEQTLKERTATLSTGDREWWDSGSKVMKARRTSLITDPADGRLPPLTPEARQRAAARAESRRGRGPADSWEDRSLQERCIWFGSAGPPMLPGPYNNNVQLLQTPDYVAIVNEMIHDVRIVPMNGQPRVGHEIPRWMGDARGHWEGNTLVVDTTNVRGARLTYIGDFHSENAHITERLTFVDANTLNYEATVDDPTVFTRPWTMRVVEKRRPNEEVWESACYEGNVSPDRWLLKTDTEHK